MLHQVCIASRPMLPRFLATVATSPAIANNPSDPFDVIVVGGGMVGFGLSALLARSSILSNKRILLLESSLPKPYQLKDTFETRTVALSCASVDMLKSVGAWDFIADRRAHPVKKMKVWEDHSDAFLTFDGEPLAHIVENTLVVEALKTAALSHDSADRLTIWHNVEVDKISLPHADRSDQLVQLEARDRDSGEAIRLNTSLLVGADGIRSKVREASGIQTIGWDHGQCAIVASLCMGSDNEEFTAWQRFLSTGPIALLPLSPVHCCLIWSTTNAEADRLMAQTDDDFVRELNAALTKPSEQPVPPTTFLANVGSRVTGIVDSLCGYDVYQGSTSRPVAPEVQSLQPNSTRGRFPLGFQLSTSYHGTRSALVGDAAHRILPLAGQGVNLGFGDVISLVNCLEKASSVGTDIGTAAYLQEYTTERLRHVVPVASAMETINAFYSNDAIAAKLLNVPGHPGTAQSRTASQLVTALLATARTIACSSIQSSSLLKTYLTKAAITGQLFPSCSNV